VSAIPATTKTRKYMSLGLMLLLYLWSFVSPYAPVKVLLYIIFQEKKHNPMIMMFTAQIRIDGTRRTQRPCSLPKSSVETFQNEKKGE
jgi:hypothetical protein